MAEHLLDDLRRHYDANGISAADFRCQHRCDCKGNHETFTEAQEAFVGTEYERGTLPRILFVSLDPGSSDDETDRRTLAGMRMWEENEIVVSTLHRGQHWYLTHKMAWTILKRFRTDLTLEDVKPYFAHTNSAKCCLHNEGRAQADYRLFANCRKYLSGEIKALQPDIIVSQGDRAKEAIQASLPPFECTTGVEADKCPYSILRIDGREALWLHTYHPRFFGGFYRQMRECWDDWAEIAFMMFNEREV